MAMARLYVYDDKKSIIHTILGLISGYSILKFPILTVIITLLFTTYEATEYENPMSTLGDFIEYFTGIILGIGFAKMEVYP